MRAFAILVAAALSLSAADTVTVIVPPSVYFAIANVTVATNASPVTVSVSNAKIPSSRYLRISVRATSSTLAPPAGHAMPVSLITWTPVGQSGGTAYAGTLSSLSYTTVFDSVLNPSSGSATLQFTFTAPGTSCRAGPHTATLQWKFETLR